MALPNVIVINILEFLRGDLFYRKRCVHTVKRGKRKRVCKHRPIKNSTFCAAHEKKFKSFHNHWEALLELNNFMIK